MEYAVESHQLTKKYGDFTALDKLNLKVDRDRLMVLLGHNGSGKTTFLNVVSTVLKPTSGTATVMGYDIVKDPLKVRQVIAISFQEPRGFWRHKPKHILAFHASMYGVDGPERSARVEKTMRDFDLWDSRDKKFMDLSGGQAKRLEVAKLFVHTPQLAILDEPTAMVDLDGKRMIWDKILELKESGASVVVATNEVREAEYLADVITIFSKGRDVVSESLVELKDSVKGADLAEMEFTSPVQDSLIEAFKLLPGTASVTRVSENKIRAKVSRSEDWIPVVTLKLHDMGIKLSSIKVTEPSLAEVFMQYIGSDQVPKRGVRPN